MGRLPLGPRSVGHGGAGLVGFLVVVGGQVEPREGAQPDGLGEGSPHQREQVGGVWLPTGQVCRQRHDAGTADPSLAPAHADSRQQLHPAKVGGSQVGDRAPDRTRGNLLAAADQGLVGKRGGPLVRCPVYAAEDRGEVDQCRPGGSEPAEPGRVDLAPGRGRDRMTGQLTLDLGERRAADAGGLAGGVDTGHARLLGPVDVDGRTSGGVEAHLAAELDEDVQLRYEAVPDRECVAVAGPGRCRARVVRVGQGARSSPAPTGRSRTRRRRHALCGKGSGAGPAATRTTRPRRTGPDAAPAPARAGDSRAPGRPRTRRAPGHPRRRGRPRPAAGTARCRRRPLGVRQGPCCPSTTPARRRRRARPAGPSRGRAPAGRTRRSPPQPSPRGSSATRGRRCRLRCFWEQRWSRRLCWSRRCRRWCRSCWWQRRWCRSCWR